MTLPDHIFVLIFAVIYPLAGFIGFRRLLNKIKAGIPVNRTHLYAQTIAWQWVLFAIAAILWGATDRTWRTLGFGFELNANVVIGAVLTVVGIAFLTGQIRQVGKASQGEIQVIKTAFGELALLIPRNGGELVRFNMLSLTAGIVEETLWRGFLFWYLGHAMPLWAAAMISAAGFGLAHGYQGVAKVPRVVLVGAVLSGLYLLTGSLWLSIVLHAAIDLLQGRMAYEVMRRNH